MERKSTHFVSSVSQGKEYQTQNLRETSQENGNVP